MVQNIASAEIREQYLDAGKARERLGWAPRHGMDAGLRRTIEWYRSYMADEIPTSSKASARPRAVMEKAT